MSEKSMISEEQIRSLRKEIDYNTRDYSIDFLIQQFRDDEFYIPDEYQRQYIWNNADKNRFVESILLGLPIPLMFFSDTEDGRCEIIDGAQMERFLLRNAGVIIALKTSLKSRKKPFCFFAGCSME